MQRSIDGTNGLLVGASDQADVDDDGAYTPVFSVGTVNGVAPVAGTITTTIAGVANVVANASTGAFTIDPAPGVTGNVTFTYTVCDSGNPAPDAVQRPGDCDFNVAARSSGSSTPPCRAWRRPAEQPLQVPLGERWTARQRRRRRRRGEPPHLRLFGHGSTSGIALNPGEWLIGQGVTNTPPTPSTP